MLGEEIVLPSRHVVDVPTVFALSVLTLYSNNKK